MEHKYIRFQNIGFVIWPKTDSLWHSHVARFVKDVPVSAGFVTFGVDSVRCYGESESMGMSSLPEDSSLLIVQLRA